MTTRKKPRANGFDFLAAAKQAGGRERVKLPGLAREVYVRMVSRAEMTRIQEASLKPGGKSSDPDAYDNERLVLLTVAAAAVDARGRRLIPEGREQELLDIPFAIQNALQTAALRINGMSAEAEPAGNA